MANLVIWIKHENGRRCYVLGKHRLHHGLTGIFTIIASILLKGKLRLISAIFGVGLIAHDLKDWKVWFHFNDQA